MSSKKIRMGFIGCGNISYYHILGTTESPDMEVGAICDILPAKLDEKANRFNIPKENQYNDYIQMLDSGKIDAVSICTPNSLHYKMALEVIERGLPYALEKPACLSAEEVKTLAEKTEKKNLPNMICFSYRFKSAARYARHLIQSGQLGKLFHINGEYLQAWGLPDSANGKPVPLNWRFTKEKSGTGALGDLGIHMVDLFRFITGKEFTRITADLGTFIHERKLPGSEETGTVDVDDYVNMIGQMEGPVAVNLSITRFAYSRGNYQRVEVYGEKGAIRYTLEENDLLEVNMGNLPTRSGHIWSAVPVPTEHNSNQMQSFADIVNGRGDGLAATIRDGWKSQQIVDNAFDSFESASRKNIE